MTNATDRKSAAQSAKASKRERRESPAQQPKLGFFGTLRWLWRQLTSMRTALFLLLILAVAAVPGSIFPQTNIDSTRVTNYLAEHRTIGPWLDRFGFFNVFSSPWFAAIYLLLVISLLGCIIPRTRKQVRALHAPIPKMPRRLDRLPEHRECTIDASPQDVLQAAQSVLRAKRYRFRVDTTAEGVPQAIAAEGGRLREAGNLLFHTCLVFVIIAVAYGHLVGWNGQVIVPAGQGFTSTASRYDTLDTGPLVNIANLTPFSINVNHMDVTFEHDVPSTSPQYGQPRDFVASVTAKLPNMAPKATTIEVNHALDIASTEVYLLGNGYAPKVTVRNAKGQILYADETPFLPQNNNYTSVGAIKVPGASPKQLGFFGFFLPTASFSSTQGPTSTFPALNNPALVLGLYEGNLFPDGSPQSVYTLDTQQMTQVKGSDGQPLRLLIRPGQTVKLPDKLGSITLDSVPRWAGLSVRYDPGKMPALYGALLALLGLIMSMTLRRRRLFVKVAAAADEGEPDDRRTLVTIGGLSKGEDPRLPVGLDNLLESIVKRTGKP
ncbi:cytochrome c biogenesis protein ResB [Leekyejoonella antrihumi]|uniref:Cytochrome c biogenesis protein ResB n=1 Tax=Leekyejoonella antrihumi TaxID=1660198 RepID=A0A563DWU4_9MICO|nr:cytochrome c biogenesis protein ResB [Leekyejoonella antrihumi]TWP34696.1 cytochrome c biogenesis protein ResB [Leekyejoonella antrihumi]